MRSENVNDRQGVFDGACSMGRVRWGAFELGGAGGVMFRALTQENRCVCRFSNMGGAMQNQGMQGQGLNMGMGYSQMGPQGGKPGYGMQQSESHTRTREHFAPSHTNSHTTLTSLKTQTSHGMQQQASYKFCTAVTC